MPIIPSFIPFRIPNGILPPHSSIFFWKYFFAPVTASEISPPKNADSPANAAPSNSNNLSAIPFQSTEAIPSLTFSPNVHQSTFSIADIPKSRIPLIPVEKVCPMPTKSIVLTALFMAVASEVPAPIQLKLLTAV